MATEVRLFISALLEATDGSFESVGDVRVPVVLTGLVGDISDVTHRIATLTARVIYDATDTLTGDAAWLFLWVESDTDAVELELATDLDGSAGAKELYTFVLKAGVPFLLASRASYSGYTEAFAAGTLDVIERINVNNPTAGTVRVRIVTAR